METKFNYFLIGIFALLAIASTLFFVADTILNVDQTDKKKYGIVFRGSIEGLRTGGSVKYNGIKVGQVSYIGLDQFDPTAIYIEISVDTRVIVNQSSYVALVSKGFSGRSELNISTQSLSAANIVKARNRSYPLLSLQKNNFNTVIDKISSILGRTEETIVTLNNIIAFNEKYINGTLVNVNLLSRDVRNILEQFSQTVTIINGLGKNFDNKADTVVQGLSNLLVQAELLTKDTRGVVQNVSRIMALIEQNPSGFILQGSDGIMQLPQHER